MGSRAVMVLQCRDGDVARKRFGVEGGERGVCYTRTGRPFFAQRDLERELLARVGAAMEKSGLWSALETAWICL